MSTKTIYGSKPEIRDIEKLTLEIQSLIYPKKQNQAVVLIKGLEAYKEKLQKGSLS